MSTGPYTAGQTIRQDPQAKKSYEFDFDAWLPDDAEITAYTITITGSDDAFDYDNDDIDTDGRGVTARFFGGTVGRSYTATCHVTTNESVPQIDDLSVVFAIKQA